MINTTNKKKIKSKVPKSIFEKEESIIKKEITDKIHSGEYKVAIFGLGHVGAPLAAVWLRKGCHVIGVDKSRTVIENALLGKTHIPEPGVNEAFTDGIRDGKFEVYDNLVRASEDSFLKMICVPVLASNGEADFTNIKDVSSLIGRGLKPGDIVSLNPSVPPGTTEDVIVPILERESRGLKAERDFFMIYNPERIYEGRAITDIEENYPAIISGIGPKSLSMANIMFSMISKKGVISLSSIKTAEMEKLLEGVYRDVNIALANELAIICKSLGINFWEARKAANSQPFCNIHKPGTGVGGACIPVYPQFIIQVAKKINASHDITRVSRIVNNKMPSYCVDEALKIFDSAYSTRKNEKSKSKPLIAILGLAFRGGVSDTRLSPSYQVIKEFNSRGYNNLIVHDPFVIKDKEIESYIKNGINIELTNDMDYVLTKADLLFISTDHPDYNNLTAKDKTIPIFDGRGILDREKFRESIISTIGIGLNTNLSNKETD